jgi:hypothetical protein
VGRVPTELGCVDPGCVVAPGCVVVVPGCDCVVDVLVCGPIPGLGVTVPVVCAVAMPAASTNTDDANRILRIESCSLCTSVANSFSYWDHSLSKALLDSGMPSPPRRDVATELPGVTISSGRAAGILTASLAERWRVGQMRYFASILPPVLKIKCEFLLCKLIRDVYSNR